MSSVLPLYGNRTPEQLKVSELREELKRRGIQCKGLKKELVERLDDAIQRELQEQRNAVLAAHAPSDVENSNEPMPKSDFVAEPNDVTPSPGLGLLLCSENEPVNPPVQMSNVQEQGTSPPDLNLAPKEFPIEHKEQCLGPKQAMQSLELEAESVEHAVESESVPDFTAKVNSVPSPYPGGIEVSLHESLSEVPEVANSDENAEQTAEGNPDLEEDHVAKVRGKPYVSEYNGMEGSKSFQDHVMGEDIVEKAGNAAAQIADEVPNPVNPEVVEPEFRIDQEGEVVEAVKVGERVQSAAEVNAEFKVEEIVLEAARGLHSDTVDVSSREIRTREPEVADDVVLQTSGLGRESEATRMDVYSETVEVVVRTLEAGVELNVGGHVQEETIVTVVPQLGHSTELSKEDTKIRDKESPVNLDSIRCDKIEHMACIKKPTIPHEPPSEALLPPDTLSGPEEVVPMDSLLPEVIPGELTVGKGSSESDEPRELDDSHVSRQVKEKSPEGDKHLGAGKSIKLEDEKIERRRDRVSRKERTGKNDERNRSEVDARRDSGETRNRTDEDKVRYDKERRYSSSRSDDDTRYDNVRRDLLDSNQKDDEELQRARRRETSRLEVRHSKEWHRGRDDTPPEDRCRVYVPSEEQRGKSEISEVDDNGKGKDIRPMEIDSEVLVGCKRKEGDADARQLEPTKRQRRWNSGRSLNEADAKSASKPAESQALKEIVPSEVEENPGPSVATLSAGNLPGMAIPRMAANAERCVSGKLQPAGVKTDVTGNGENPKLRVVPPSTRTATTSLKIDRFLRPFTFKAVKDLLSQTGTVKEIWMDHIKTHCYITYSSVEEAIATREAVYNLQWPPHGGKLLTAEFVEPEEVKIRSEGPSDKAALTPVTTPRGSTPNSTPGGTLCLAQASSNSPMASVPAPAAFLGPPSRDKPSVPPKRELEPVPTLDDLFKKTRAKPHIYYLPLTGDQVAAKIVAASKPAIMKPPVRV